MTAITFILITVLVGAAIHQAHKFGYDKGYHEGYEDGEYEGSSSLRTFDKDIYRVLSQALKQMEENV